MAMGIVRHLLGVGITSLLLGMPGDVRVTLPSGPRHPELTADDFGIVRLSETEWRVSTAKVAQYSRQSLPQLVWMLESGFTPLVEEGRLVGYRVGEIHRAPLFGEMGLQDGDVIRLFNGEPITSFYDMRLRFGRGGPVSSIGVERDGQMITLSYRFE